MENVEIEIQVRIENSKALLEFLEKNAKYISEKKAHWSVDGPGQRLKNQELIFSPAHTYIQIHWKKSELALPDATSTGTGSGSQHLAHAR